MMLVQVGISVVGLRRNMMMLMTTMYMSMFLAGRYLAADNLHISI